MIVKRAAVELDLHQVGKKWFPWFRLYGPEKAVFDKRFKLPDIELVK